MRSACCDAAPVDGSAATATAAHPRANSKADEAALVTELRLSGSGYVVRVGSGPDCAELPVSRRHTRELKDRLVRATKQAWSQR